MAGLSDFKTCEIVIARMAGAYVTKVAKLFDIAKSSLLKVIAAFEKEGKQNSWRKRKLSDRDY